MNKKGEEGAHTNTFYVIIGIVIAVMMFFAFAQGIAPYLKPKDKSLEGFNKLAGKIEELSNSMNQEVTEAVMIHINDNELILFFDNNTNSSVKVNLLRDWPVDYYFFNQQEKWDNLLRNPPLSGGKFITHVFDKPTSCGNQACMVLCRDFEIYKPENRNVYIKNEAPYLQKIPSDFSVIFCKNTVAIKTFPKITHFYRKPYVAILNLEAKNIPTGEKIPLQEFQSKGNVWDYFYGLNLFFVGDFFHDLNLKIGERKKAEFVKSKESPDLIGEFVDTKNAEFSFLMSGQYVYVQPLDNNMVLCYKPPCVFLADKIYLEWQKYLDMCLESNNCGSLFSAVDDFTDTSKLVFSNKNNKLYIEHGDYTLPFDKDIELYIKRTEEEKKDFPASSVSIEKVYIYMFGIELLVLEANNNRYMLIDISSLSDDKLTKPKLIFKVKGEELEE